VESYDPIANSWTPGLASMSTVRSNFGVGVVNGIIYAVGGDDLSGNPLETVESYNPSSNTWTPGLANMPVSLSQMTVGVVNGIIYVAGGDPNTGFTTTIGVVNTLESYNPSSNTWTSGLATMPDSVECALGVGFNGLFYVVGGVDNGAYPGMLNTAYAYSPGANSWSTKSPMPNNQSGQSGQVVNGVIYSIGGWNGSSFLNNNQSGALTCQ
jgi:N-acetylneuraminic acid mutarotase